MITIIAEKPSVGKELAAFLGASNSKDGYLEGNGYYVTWAYGHLFELKDFKEVGFDGQWNINNLPFIPSHYEIKLKDDGGVRKQYKIITELFSKSNQIICATDAGREGELIFRYIYQYAKTSVPLKRLWVSSLTTQALEKAFKELKPGSQYDNLFKAARSRNQADYLVGLNATMGLTSKADLSGIIMSLGRVQTPTLALICQRYLDNKNFVPVPYYTIKILLEKEGKSFWLNSKEKWDDKTIGETVFLNIKDAINATIVKVTKNEKKEQPPLLYDLTSLQQAANNSFGYSANDTLEIAQSLYESKFITYPRTGSCYIGDDIFDEIPVLLKKVKSFSNGAFNEVIDSVLKKPLNKRSVNSKKVTDHHALLPTEIIPNNFPSENHKNIYSLIFKRFVEAFSEACVKDMTTIEANVSSVVFSATGSIIKVQGWRTIRLMHKEVDEDSDNEINFPELNEGETVLKKDISFNELFTKAKPLHTEATILNAMETCGKDVEEEELKEAMKETGIGTPATRASIIELLFKRSYIKREKKNLLPTDLGMGIFLMIQDFDIAKPDLTGLWEHKLLLMERGEYSEELFNNEIIEFTNKTIEDLKNVKPTIARYDWGTCPCCKGKLLENRAAIYCENAKENNCIQPAIYKVVSNKHLKAEDITDLIKTGKTKLIKGFSTKEGKKFDAILQIKDNKLCFDFTKDEIGICPKCKQGKITEFNKSYSCDRYKEGCTFTIWKEIAKKKISLSAIKNLLTKGTSGIIKGFKGKENTFDAELIFDNDFKTTFKFSNKK